MIHGSNKKITLLSCASFENLCQFFHDPLVLAKPNIALIIAMAIRSFLVEYQVDKPIVFFLARDLETVVRKLLMKFIKYSILSEAEISGLLRLDIVDVRKYWKK